mmetsp:Transcript_12255/g.33646  ORF Transcript_12255/g.33646 Transcript_12255/m.33646 type:complete len:536 (-) Transcript_12255:52-1659(-)
MFTSVLVCATFPLASVASGFLDSSGGVRSAWASMNESFGCKGSGLGDDFSTIEYVVTPIWHTMPKSAEGLVNFRSLRFLADRYFNHMFSMRLRGFDGTETVSLSSWDMRALDERVPGFSEVLFSSRFTLDNAVLYVAGLQEIVLNYGDPILQKVIQDRGEVAPFSYTSLTPVLDLYVLHWIGGDAFDGTCFRTQGSQNDLCFEIPHEDELRSLARAQVARLEFSKRSEYRSAGLDARSYSASDAHLIIRNIAKNFAWFYETDCREMRTALIEMDSTGTGRVPLSKFYSSHDNFGETEDYLNKLGVLDYMTSSREAQVIIPNYIQAASNCIVSTSQYHICCPNYCEQLFREVEMALGTSEATEQEILDVVGNMTDLSSFDDGSTHVDGALSLRLSEVASAHGGKVKLHGRLFAQWLHYVFPRDCPFPHKAGTVSTASAMEHSGSVEIEVTERAVFIEETFVSDTDLSKNNTDWMSQWDEDEELLAGYTQSHGFSLPRDRIMVLFGLALIAAGYQLRGKATNSHPQHRCDVLKSHYV